MRWLKRTQLDHGKKGPLPGLERLSILAVDRSAAAAERENIFPSEGMDFWENQFHVEMRGKATSRYVKIGG